MKLKESSTFFNALADETRLRILSLLGGGELCVCDIMGVLSEPQSKVSRHLATLRRSGLVEARRKGLWMYYRLSRPRVKTFGAVFAALRAGRSEFQEIRRDEREFRKKKGCLVSCCS